MDLADIPAGLPGLPDPLFVEGAVGQALHAPVVVEVGLPVAGDPDFHMVFMSFQVCTIRFVLSDLSDQVGTAKACQPQTNCLY